MRDRLKMTGIIACMIMVAGCCKGTKTQDVMVDQKPSTTVVDQIQPAPQQESMAVGSPSPSIETQEIVREMKEPTGENAGSDTNSLMIWATLILVSLMVGWLVYKFIFRKR